MENNTDDFKYVLQDVGHIYIGKQLSYNEILQREDVAFKFKAIIQSYIIKEIDLEQKMSQHILQLSKEKFSYQIYEQLKLQIRIFYREESGKKKKEKWIHKTCKLEEFCKEYRDLVVDGSVMIEDMSISKLALMTISI